MKTPDQITRKQEFWAIETPEGEIVEGSFSSDKTKCLIGYWCEISTEPMPKGHDKLVWMCDLKAKGFKEVKLVRASDD